MNRRFIALICVCSAHHILFTFTVHDAGFQPCQWSVTAWSMVYSNKWWAFPILYALFLFVFCIFCLQLLPNIVSHRSILTSVSFSHAVTWRDVYFHYVGATTGHQMTGRSPKRRKIFRSCDQGIGAGSLGSLGSSNQRQCTSTTDCVQSASHFLWGRSFGCGNYVAGARLEMSRLRCARLFVKTYPATLRYIFL